MAGEAKVVEFPFGKNNGEAQESPVVLHDTLPKMDFFGLH